MKRAKIRKVDVEVNAWALETGSRGHSDGMTALRISGFVRFLSQRRVVERINQSFPILGLPRASSGLFSVFKMVYQTDCMIKSLGLTYTHYYIWNKQQGPTV